MIEEMNHLKDEERILYDAITRWSEWSTIMVQPAAVLKLLAELNAARAKLEALREACAQTAITKLDAIGAPNGFTYAVVTAIRATPLTIAEREGRAEKPGGE
jgi:hypothetical protein